MDGKKIELWPPKCKTLKESITILGTGSNLGDKKINLQTAENWIAERVGDIVQKSGYYLTEAWGNRDQPVFWNQVLVVKTRLTPLGVLDTILDIERDMGRIRRIKWGERLIDIDLLFYDDVVLDTPNLQIPHPYLQDRNFVLAPLLEIQPDWMHPILNKSVRELALLSKDPLKAVRLAD